MNIELSEEISVYTVGEIRERIINLLNNDVKDDMVFNLQNLKELDGAGLQLLISLQKTCDQLSKKCHFIFPEELKENIKIYGISDVLDMEVR